MLVSFKSPDPNLYAAESNSNKEKDFITTLIDDLNIRVFEEVNLRELSHLSRVSKKFNKSVKKYFFNKCFESPDRISRNMLSGKKAQSLEKFINYFYFELEKRSDLNLKYAASFTVEGVKLLLDKFPNLKKLTLPILIKDAQNNVNWGGLESLEVENANFDEFNFKPFPRLTSLSITFKERNGLTRIDQNISKLIFENNNLKNVRLLFNTERVVAINQLIFSNTSLQELEISGVSVKNHEIHKLKNLKKLIFDKRYGGQDLDLSQLRDNKTIETLIIKGMNDLSNLSPIDNLSNLIYVCSPGWIPTLSENLHQLLGNYPKLKTFGLVCLHPSDEEQCRQKIQNYRIEEKLAERKINFVFEDNLNKINV